MVGPWVEEAQFGHYSGQSLIKAVTPLEGMADRAQRSGITVSSIPWQSKNFQVVPTSVLSVDADGAPGLSAEYFAGLDMKAEPRARRADKRRPIGAVIMDGVF